MAESIQAVVESIKDLTTAVTDLKVANNGMALKMEQLYTSIERLENSIEKLEKVTESISVSVSGQEKRITVLEQRVPANLVQDLAVLKSNQESQSKVLWLVGSGAALALMDSIFKLIH
jgi:predicted RNase H-like nuclease (RuvC/YqgF family)